MDNRISILVVEVISYVYQTIQFGRIILQRSKKLQPYMWLNMKYSHKELTKSFHLLTLNHLRNNTVPYAVRSTWDAAVVMMLQARTKCYPGWTTEYSGYLMDKHNLHKDRNEYVCVWTKYQKVIQHVTETMMELYNNLFRLFVIHCHVHRISMLKNKPAVCIVNIEYTEYSLPYENGSVNYKK